METNEYKSPHWQRRRLEIMQRDGWRCVRCGDGESELNVHHRRYIRGKKVWESPDEDLATFCRPCHEFIHNLRVESNPVRIGDLLPVMNWHGFYHYIAPNWLCWCGCGGKMTKAEFGGTDER